MVRQAFDLAYRRVALSDLTFIGYDSALEKPLSSIGIPWRVIGGDAEIVLRREGLRRPAQELHYSFQERGAFSV